MQGQPLPQVADAIVDRLNNDGGEARVILDPPGMGEIVIKLHATGGHVHVEVIAQRADALQVLRDGSPSLQTLLQDRGLDMGTAQFTLSQQGQGGQQQAPDQSPKNTGNGFAQLMGIDEPDATNRNFNLLRAAYNPDGAHLYRV
jgi:flagellar hook-length control protein FliK